MLPHSKFQWASEKEIEILNDFFKIRADSEDIKWEDIWEEDVGFFIEADIEFPDDVKSKLANFPPAPHRVKITHSALSEFTQNLIQVCICVLSPCHFQYLHKYICRILTQTILRGRSCVSH